MTDLIDQPDWPDRGRWVRPYAAQFLHDVDYAVRSLVTWNKTEDQDLLNQVNADVGLQEIARRHQRHVHEIEDRRFALMRELEKKLLR